MNGSETKFKLIFEGRLAAGQTRTEVEKRLAALLKATPEQVAQLFSGKRLVLKSGLTLEAAEKLQRVMTKAGAIAEIKPASNPPQAGPTSTEGDILDAFLGTIEPIPLAPHYRNALIAVAAAMLLLPMFYFLIVAASAYGVYLHATHDAYMIDWLHGRGRLLALTLYLTPILAGSFIVLFMLKPFLFLGGQEPQKTLLRSQDAPQFFAFVAKICDTVDAPRPHLIYVDSDVNASASIHGGLSGIMGDRLVLTVGLPLVAGMTSRQLAGILAHEFGHFSQGAGMRFSYVIRWINHWLATAAFKRDAMDKKLEEWSNSESFYILIALSVSRLGVWITRQILALLVKAGAAISGLLLRQMEFDADRYEARVAGSEHFADTFDRLNHLAYAHGALHEELRTLWEQDHPLVDDISSAIDHLSRNLAPVQRKQLADQLEEHRPSLYDTHPPEAERIANALQEQAPGVFHDERPAHSLFVDFKTLSRRATLTYYRQYIRPDFPSGELISLEQFLSPQVRGLVA